MNAGLLVSGIILMALGVAGFLYVQTALSECASVLGQIGQMFSSGTAQKCQIANYIQMGGGVLFVIGIGLTIGGAVTKKRHQQSYVKPNYLDILKERYAKGEISKEEFEKMKKDFKE